MQLQRKNLELKDKIGELNDMIYGITDTDKQHQNVKKVVELHKENEKINSELIEKITENKELESNLETLQQENMLLKAKESSRNTSKDISASMD